MIGHSRARQSQESNIGQRGRPGELKRRDHEESTAHAEEKPHEMTMRPKSDHAPHHCHDRTHHDSIQSVFYKRKQGAKAKCAPNRSKKREATGDSRRHNEGTERTHFVKQMFHRSFLRQMLEAIVRRP